MPKVRCSHCQKVYEASTRKTPCPGCGQISPKLNGEARTPTDSRMVGAISVDDQPMSPQAAELGTDGRVERIILCPGCKVRLNVNLKKYGGKKVACPACSANFRMPQLGATSDA